MIIKKKGFILICFLVLFGTACSKTFKANVESCKESAGSFKGAAQVSRFSEDAADEAFGGNNTESPERKLVKTGEVRFETGSIKKTRETIEELLKKHKAYISFENEFSYGERLNQDFTIKIPKDNFETFLAELTDGVKKLESKTVNVSDVTEEFIDITARLRVKKEAEAGYLKLINQAKNVKDILDIQNQIQSLRSDIEAIEGRLRYLENSVNFSVLNVFMYQKVKNAEEPYYFLKRVWAALKGGVLNFAEAFILLLYGWVFVIAAVIIIIAVFKTKKYRRNKNER